MTAPICPVCGQEMKLTNTTKAQWMCFHGDNLEVFGCYFGPGNDSSGDLTRAQIAAMEQRIHDNHPHTDADGETAGVDFRNDRITVDPGMKEAIGYACYVKATTPAKPEACGEWWRTGKCGECAWAGTIRTLEFKDGPAEVIFCRRNTFGHTGMVQEGGASVRVELTQGMCYANTPACPAGVRR